MNRGDALAIVVGMGLTFGFLGFLAFLIMQSRQQEIPIEPQPQVPAEVCVPNTCPPVMTEETAPTRPHITNQILQNANQWYEIPIPSDIRTWSMNARGTYDIYYSFEPSHATYKTLFSGMFLDSDTMPQGVTPTALYVSSNTANAVVEMTFFR